MNATLTRHGHVRLGAGVTCQSESLISGCHLSCRGICRFGIVPCVDMDLTLCLSALRLCLRLGSLCGVLLMLSQLPLKRDK